MKIFAVIKKKEIQGKNRKIRVLKRFEFFCPPTLVPGSLITVGKEFVQKRGLKICEIRDIVSGKIYKREI